MFVLRAFGLSGAPLPVAKSQFQHLPIRIGRNPLNDFVLEFTMISNFHARIEDNNGSVCVRDLGSRNGIFLPSPSGGNPVRIAPNTSVDLGPSNLRFFVSPHVQLTLEVVAQQAPVRNALACGTVLGNLSIISQSGSHPSEPRLADASQLQAVQSNLSPLQPGRPSAASVGPDFGRQRLPIQFDPHGRPLEVSSPLAANPSNWPDRGAATPYRSYPASSQPPPAGHGPFPDNSVAASAGPPWPPGAPPISGAPAVPPMGGAQPGASTQSFQLDLQTLALMGLREMASSLIPQRKLETSGDIARFITKLHDAMDVFCRTFIPLRQGYAEFVASLDLQRAASGRSAHVAPSTVALTQARTPEAVAMALLDPHDRSFEGPVAVEGILADLMIHQVALLDGVMEGVRSLLDELSPQAIEQATGSGGAAGLLGTKYKSRWEEFCRRFEKLSEGQQAFSFVFGQDFAEVYRQYWHRKAGSEDASLRTERPPG